MTLNMKRSIWHCLKKKRFVGVLFCSMGFMSMLQGSTLPLEAGSLGIMSVWGQMDDNGVNHALKEIKQHLETLDKKIEEKSQQQFVFWNHYLSSMQCALEGKPSAYQEQTVDQLYDMLGAVPGHHTRHHRDFRNVLVQTMQGVERIVVTQQSLHNDIQSLSDKMKESPHITQLLLDAKALNARLNAVENTLSQTNGGI